MVGSPSLVGTSVLAYAYQLKVQSKNPQDFLILVLPTVMGKIRNALIKLHLKKPPHFLSSDFGQVCPKNK